MRLDQLQFKSSERGQGTLEYILILAISVSLVLLLSQRVYKPMGQLGRAIMGDYLGCLLDKGVLPKLGSSDDACAEAMKLSPNNPFSKEGAAAQAARNAEKEKEAKAKQASEQQEMADSREGAPTRGRSIAPAPVHIRSTSSGADGPGEDSKVTQVANPLPQSKYYKVINVGGAQYDPAKVMRAQGLEGLLAAEKEKLKKREEKTRNAGSLDEGSFGGKQKKMLVKSPQRKLAADDRSEPMTFGKLFRLFLVVLIIIAVIIFLGTQALQISKSWEK